ncbi:MAG: hypothetical protein ACRDSJ_02775 [Rubrobacteraceae bacterium]
MPGYLVDEGGERTHAVLPVDEYERLKKAEERLESVRGYAMEMISAMNQEESQENGQVEERHDEQQENSEREHQEQGWYQRQ